MNWKLIAVVLTSLILLIVCYLTVVSPFSDVKKYFVNHEQKEPIYDFKIVKKIKISFSKEEEFLNFVSVKDFVSNTNDFTNVNEQSNEYIAYYFPEGCPSYKLGYLLVDTNEEGRDNYYVPEDGYLIIVNKEHRWTKEPSFKYWKSPINTTSNNIAQEKLFLSMFFFYKLLIDIKW